LAINELVKKPPFYVGLGSGAAAAAAVALLIPGVLPIAAGAAGVIGFAAGIMGSSSFGRNKNTGDVAVVELDLNGSIPDALKIQLQNLRRIALIHGRTDSPLFASINEILQDSQELFTRISSKMDSQAHRLAAVNYTNTLKKLNKALDVDYYLDIKKNPRLWDNREARISAVERAVAATAAQLLKNIQQVNASQDIEYEVSLDSLINSLDSADASALIDTDSNS